MLFLQGVATGCEERGAGLSLVPRQPELAALQVRGALVDGFILYCPPEDDERVEAVRRRGLPYGLVDYRPRPGTRQVGIDDRGAARAGARHLLDLAIAALFARETTRRQFTGAPGAPDAARRTGRIRHVVAAGLRRADERLEPALRRTTSPAR